MPEHTSTPAPDDFYVGYLPMPQTHRRALRVLIPAILWLAAISAAIIALTQRDPGPAVWDTGLPVSREGTLVAHPYPILRVAPQHPGDPPTTIFLVQEGKHGAQDRVASNDGVHVRIRGWRLDRDGREILELLPDADAVTPLPSQSPVPAPTTDTLGPITLRGEIVDYKCFLGAMKPGDGKGHKACATLCISRGIPPMLVVPTTDGHDYYLLVTDRGEPLPPPMLDLVGEPVVVSGILRRFDGINMLSVPPDNIRRSATTPH
ncbi:MAG: hypothetical protein KF745_00695 [Phycisphaeraceae bacterium]|nr:hypothetical protein [Phycisphaeraceae bacterium]